MPESINWKLGEGAWRAAGLRKAICSVVAVLLLLIPGVAQVSQTHIVSVSLDELLQGSSHIVITAADSPPTVSEEVPFSRKRFEGDTYLLKQVKKGKAYRPYTRLVQRFRVEEALRGDLLPGTVVEVLQADDSMQESMHWKYEIEGVTKSYYDRRYQRQSKFFSGSAEILFLKQRANTKRYVYVAGDASEDLAMRKEIETRLNLSATPIEDLISRPD